MTPEANLSRRSAKDNWFSKNPKKSVFFFLLIIICLLIFFTEKILEYTSKTHISGIKRSIRLREYEPLLERYQYYYDPDHKTYDAFIEKEYWLKVDCDGFIMPSKIHDNPDMKIIFLGASTTECTWVNGENKFPYVVGRLIENNIGIKTNSYNASKPANNSLHSLNILLNKLIPLNPDIIVMMHNINDLIALLYEKTYWNKNPYRSPIETEKATITKKLRDIRDLTVPYFYAGIKDVIRLIRGNKEIDEFKQVRGEKIVINKAYLLQEFRLNLESFIHLCSIRKITPVLMTQMSRLKKEPDPHILEKNKKLSEYHGITYDQFRDLFDSFNQEIRNVGAQYNILVIDLAKNIPPDKEHLFDFVHLTDKGSILAANIIYQDLLPLINQKRIK